MDNLILNQIEKEYRKNNRHPGPSELLDIFPEAAKYIKNKLKDWQWFYEKEEEIKKAQLERALVRLHSLGPVKDEEFQVWFLTQIIYELDLERIKEKMKPLESLMRILEWKKNPKKDGSIKDIDIERAKEFPITNLVTPNRGGFILCPFHHEKTPSCKIYEENNHWHCFGCGAGGDVIDLVMQENDIDFISAVKRLI